MSVFNLPDLGEGLPDAEIRQWHVAVGDHVQSEQPLVSMETAKAIVEVPSPEQGVITQLHGKVGDVIKTGAALVSFETASTTTSTTVAGSLEQSDEIVAETAYLLPHNLALPKLSPALRALAKHLQVDPSTLTGTGPAGRITIADLQDAQHAQAQDGQPLQGARRHMATVMSQSHLDVVPVSIFDSVTICHWSARDITYRLIRAICFAAQQEPQLNAWYHGAQASLQQHNHVNLGLATDSESGLLVPTIHDAQHQCQDATQCRTHINAIKTAVKTRSLPPEALKGATITLSNFGMYAGTHATPIVVPPQVAIVAAGRVHDAPDVENGVVCVKTRLPLSLTFDHRAVTGGEATRFLAAIIEDLTKSN